MFKFYQSFDIFLPILGLSEQDCVELRRNFELPFKLRQITRTSMTTSLYKWNDRGCKEENYFVCERPIADGNKSIDWYLHQNKHVFHMNAFLYRLNQTTMD